MHELAVCQALIGEVSALAAARRANSITDIHVNIGPLSGVEWPLLQRAFPLAAAGTVADGAKLHLRKTPIRVRCSICDAETEAEVNKLVCGHCGEWRTRLVSGDELVLRTVEMQSGPRSESCVTLADAT